MAFSTLSRVTNLVLVSYIAVALFYTTSVLVVGPVYTQIKAGITNTPMLSKGTPWTKFPSSLSLFGGTLNGRPAIDSAFNLKHSGLWDPFHDADSAFELSNLATSEDLFISKAFSQSMQPSKIIPYFYRRSGTFDTDDITITTLVTSNRFTVFSQLVRRYKGPISVAIHVKNESSHIQELLDSLHAMYTSTPLMATNVDVHLVVDSFDRQFNTWRNIARLFARTDFVMMLDVDFAICTDFRGAIRANRVVLNKLRQGDSAFVIPAFEYPKHFDGIDQNKFPVDKKTLLELVKANKVGMFHASWQPGHNSTNYPQYYSAKPGEIYKVTEYQSAYEPYVVMKKEGPPWCDERFVGYGGNKAACLYEMYLSGISFFVLSDHFIVHQNHRYEEATRKNERKFNRKRYSEFREETCLRYLKSYQENGLLSTTKGSNVLEECKKIKGISRLLAQILH